MLDTTEVNRRLTHRLADLKRTAATRRSAAETARQAFERTLDSEIAPTMRQVAQALKPHGFGFAVQTPAGAARMVADRSTNDFIDIALDTARTPPAVVARSQYTRGRRLLEDERVVAEGEVIAALDAERVLEVLLDLLAPFVEK